MNKYKGFSLIELSIVLIIMGLMLSAYLNSFYSVYTSQKYKKTKQDMETIAESIEIFLFRNGRLPCPAAVDLDIQSKSYAIEGNCISPEDLEKISVDRPKEMKGLYYSVGRNNKVVVTGFLPVRSMNLNQELIEDNWSKKYLYAVTLSLAFLQTYESSAGGIYISDEFGNSLVMPEGSAQYVLISRGEQDNKINDFENENYDWDAFFNLAPLSKGTFNFDDLILYETWISPPSEQSCRLGDVAGFLKNKANPKIEKNRDMLISNGQTVSECAKDDRNCPSYVCSYGHFIKSTVTLDSLP